VNMDVLYIYVQSNLRNSSQIFFNKILCFTMKIDFKKFTKNGILLFWDWNLVNFIRIAYGCNDNYVRQKIPIFFLYYAIKIGMSQINSL